MARIRLIVGGRLEEATDPLVAGIELNPGDPLLSAVLGLAREWLTRSRLIQVIGRDFVVSGSAVRRLLGDGGAGGSVHGAQRCGLGVVRGAEGVLGLPPGWGSSAVRGRAVGLFV